MAAVPELGRAAGVEPRVAPEAAATTDLYERYSRQIFAFCVQQLGNREEAEDAVQTTFLNAFRGLSRGISPDAESAWLYKIAHNVCLTRRRSTYRRGRIETPGDMQALQDFVAAPQRMGADELIELQEALAAMPSNQRKAILLREWRGLSYREIADEMDLSQAAVETLIFRARRSLASGLEQAPPERKKLLNRLRHTIDVGMFAASLKALFAGSAAVKAVATAAAVSTTVGAVATVPSGERVPRRAPVERPAPAVVPADAERPAPAVARRTAPTIGSAAVSVDRAPQPRTTRPVQAKQQQRGVAPVAAAPAVAEQQAAAPQVAAAAPAPVAEAPAPAAERTEPPRAEPKAEQPKAEQPKGTQRTEAAPKDDQAKHEQPKGGEKAAEPKAEQPKAGAAKREEKAQEPKSEPVPRYTSGHPADAAPKQEAAAAPAPNPNAEPKADAPKPAADPAKNEAKAEAKADAKADAKAEKAEAPKHEPTGGGNGAGNGHTSGGGASADPGAKGKGNSSNK